MGAKLTNFALPVTIGKLPLAICGPVAQFGSALPWHGRGRRFDPDQVHQLNQLLNSFNSLQLGSILAANFQWPAKTASLFPFSTATCRTGFLVLKLRTLPLFAGGPEGSGPPSLFPPLFRVSS